MAAAEGDTKHADIVNAEVPSYADLQSAEGKKYTVYNISVTDSADHGVTRFPVCRTTSACGNRASAARPAPAHKLQLGWELY